MLLNTDYIYPTDLTGYVRAALADYQLNKFTLSQFLPNDPVDDIDYRLVSGGAGLANAASFRTYDAESPIGRRQGLSRISGELPPLSQKIRLGEYDRLRQRKESDPAIVNALYNDAEEMTESVAARMELARGDALVNGSVTISENGISGVVVNYGRTGAHTVTAGTLWTNGAADILNDLMSWRDTYEATNGVEPGAIVGSRRIWNLMLRNVAVRNQVFPGSNQPSIVTTAAINQMLESEGLPPFTMYRSQVNVNGTATKVIPDNKLLLLPAAVDPSDVSGTQLGATVWGTTAEALDPSYGIELGDEPGIVSGVYMDQDPLALWTKASAIGLPVLANPNLSFCATVA